MKEALGLLPQEEAKCDFCSAQPVTIYFSAEDSEVVGEVVGGELHGAIIGLGTLRGAWAACAECERLVKSDNREALVRRSVDRLMDKKRYPTSARAGVEAIIRATHENGFWRSRR